MSTGLNLFRRDGTLCGFTQLDPVDVEHYGQWIWRLHKQGYACRGESREGRFTLILLARDVLGLTPGDPRQADHRNRDRLDNRRENLRIVTAAVQAQNVSSNRGSTSRFRGVSWFSSRGVWRAYVYRKDLGFKHLGYFAAEEDAAKAAKAGRREYLPYSYEVVS